MLTHPGPLRRESTGASADLDERLTSLEERNYAWPRVHKDLAQHTIGRIATGEPDNLRWRAVTLEECDEVCVFCQDDCSCRSGGVEDHRILRVAQVQVAHRDGVNAARVAEPRGERRRELSIDPDDHEAVRGNGGALGGEDRMVESTARETEARSDVGELEVRELCDDLGRGKAGCEEVQHVDDANPHTAHAGTSSALVGIDGDPIHKLNGLSHGGARGGKWQPKYSWANGLRHANGRALVNVLWSRPAYGIECTRQRERPDGACETARAPRGRGASSVRHLRATAGTIHPATSIHGSARHGATPAVRSDGPTPNSIAARSHAVALAGSSSTLLNKMITVPSL